MILILSEPALPLTQLPFLFPLLLSQGPAAWVEREAYLMGTTLRVTVAASDRQAGIEAIGQVFGEVRRAEARLSTWRDDSEITALNQAPAGRPVRLSPELHAVLAEAAAWSRRTGGAFDPAIGALIDAWDLRGAGRVPSEERLERARAASGMKRFDLADLRRGAVRRDTLAWLDTGGFGKGVALRDAARLLRARGIHNGLLNFGGQVLALGQDERGAAWIVPVAHPSRRKEPAMWLRVRDVSVSTSSQSERGIVVGGRHLGHILDPRSGMPVSAWGSVTVVAADPVSADVLSTALLVVGPDAALRWAERRHDIGVLVMEEREGGVVPRWNAGMERFLAVNSILTRGG